MFILVINSNLKVPKYSLYIKSTVIVFAFSLISETVFFTNLSDLGAHDSFALKNKIISQKNLFWAKYRLSMGGPNRLKIHRRY